MTRHILVALSADPPPPGTGSELEAWSKHHVEMMVGLPSFATAQAFRLNQRHDFVFPATRATRPPYQNHCIYDIAEGQLEEFLKPPEGPAPEPPGGIGPHRPDGYLFSSVSEQFRKKA
jgi:hypothetical protein